MSSGPKTTTNQRQKTKEEMDMESQTNTSGTTNVDMTGGTLSGSVGQSIGETTNNGVSSTQGTSATQNQTNEQTQNYQNTIGGQTGTNTNVTQNTAYAPAEPVLQSILGAAGGLVNGNLTSEEQQAIGGMQQQALNNTSFAPAQQQAAAGMLAGGGFGAGDQYIQQGNQSAQNALGKTADGYYLDQQNPYLNSMLTGAMDSAMNKVGAQFAGAGRSFSGAHRDATAAAMTNAALPQLFQNYQFERQQQANAGNSLMGAGTATSGALGANRAGALNAQQAAGGMLNSTYDPYNTALAGSQAARNLPTQQLSMLTGIVNPIGSAYGGQVGMGTTDATNYSGTTGGSQTQGTSNTTNQTAGTTATSETGTSTQLTAQQQAELEQKNVLTQLESLSNTNQEGTNKGNTTGNTTSQQQNDPFQTMLGAGITLGSAWLGSDRRMKTDIAKLGTLDSGLNLYVFRYLPGFEDGGVHIGVMADEVEKIAPHAVMTGEDGYKRVNYAAVEI